MHDPQQQQQIQPKDDSKKGWPASVGGLLISSRECLKESPGHAGALGSTEEHLRD